ncbi:MAG: hypothetical protein N2511_04775, partial [Thermodesulfovibrionales bacterium]|nr:hypothetical protein [Thermodesulfovibrionales bacterium]
IIEKGYTIVYNPQSVVYHSHKYSLLQVFRRFFDTGVSLKDLGLSTGNFKEGLEILFKQIRYCLKELGMINFLLFLPYLISYEFMRFAGYLLGQNYKRLPNSLVIKFSHHKYYWDKKISQNSKI